MNDDFLLVHKSILPDYFPQVIKARNLIQKDNLSVTDACKTCGISRSTYYKYKDDVYAPTGSLSKKAILALKTEDFPGVLSAILQTISKSGANILTISQDMPIHGLAYINMMINIRNMTITLDDLVNLMVGVEHVRKVDILTYE
ncbi:MAG: ACT domain-containing protein [Bacilli bacterium]|jgi:chorismate mutase|nr:ACT domain-containing protein [Bacilli bacterium]